MNTVDYQKDQILPFKRKNLIKVYVHYAHNIINHCSPELHWSLLRNEYDTVGPLIEATD